MESLTKRHIFNTFYRIMLEKPFNTIRVKDICEASGVSRATFYEYFADKYELALYLFYQISDTVHPAGSTRTRYEQFIDYLTESRKYRGYFTNLYFSDPHEFMKHFHTKTLGELYIEMLSGSAAGKSYTGIKEKYFSEYHSAGVTTLLIDWITARDPGITAEEMASIIYQCLLPAIRMGLYGSNGPEM